MIEYKINVDDALKRAGFSYYKALKSGFLSQETLRKLKNEETNISLKSLNALCVLLDIDIKDLIKFTLSEEEKEKREEILKNKK